MKIVPHETTSAFDLLDRAKALLGYHAYLLAEITEPQLEPNSQDRHGRILFHEIVCALIEAAENSLEQGPERQEATVKLAGNG